MYIKLCNNNCSMLILIAGVREDTRYDMLYRDMYSGIRMCTDIMCTVYSE